SSTARQHCDSALQQLKELERPVLACQAEFLSGKVAQALGHDDHAYESYCRARSLLETLRGNLRGEELKIAFFHDKLEVYENLIEREQLRPEERSPERIQKLEQQAREREHDLMRAAQEATAVEMSDAGLQAPSNISLDEIRATVFPTTALVEYFSVQDRILAC